MNLIFEVQEPKALQCGLSRPQVPSPSLWPPDRSACMWATALATFSLSLGHSLDMTCSETNEVAQATKRLLRESQPEISWPHRHLLSMTPEPCLPKHRNVPDTFCTAIQGCSRYAPVRSVIAAACCSPRILSPALFACRSVAVVDLQDRYPQALKAQNCALQRIGRALLLTHPRHPRSVCARALPEGDVADMVVTTPGRCPIKKNVSGQHRCRRLV